MIPWKKIDSATVPGQDSVVTLLKRGEEFSIRTQETELMNSRVHGSEDALAALAYSRHKKKQGATGTAGMTSIRILIGGLGMGYTLAAALEHFNPDAQIIVSELIPAVVKWNREYLGHLARMPLNDPRVTVRQEDVAKIIREKKSVWDAILLDVDNGPAGLTRKANNRLYNESGLNVSFDALRGGGVLAVWSSAVDEAFTRRLKKCGFNTEIKTVRARKSGKGSRHTIWLASKL